MVFIPIQLRLNLFYPNPSYEVVTEYYVYSRYALIADIGGYLVMCIPKYTHAAISIRYFLLQIDFF
jgi:hypothetical protein